MPESRNINPLVSIITGVYNGEKYLEQTIESVLNQTYQNVEYIIIDGSSTDHTIDIIKKYQSKISHWQSERDNGLYDAWNKGLTVAKGEWIVFIGCDDVLSIHAIASYVNYINTAPLGLEYVSSKIELVTNDLKPMRIVGSPWMWNDFKVKMTTAHVGSMHNRVLFEKYGNYNHQFRIAGDYELLLRPREKLKAGFVDEITVKMRSEDGLSVTGNKRHFETRNAKVKAGGRNIFLANVEMAMAILKAKIRKALNYYH